jgi:hypothetical protein
MELHQHRLSFLNRLAEEVRRGVAVVVEGLQVAMVEISVVVEGLQVAMVEISVVVE